MDNSSTSHHQYPRLICEYLDPATGAAHYMSSERLRATTLIGQNPGCDICLAVSAVSDHHCMITLDDGQVYFWDLHSETGVEVNGKAVQQGELVDGDQLTIGPYRFSVVVNTSPYLDLNLPDSDFNISDRGVPTQLQADEEPIELTARVSEREIAEVLSEAGLITSFQANWLLTGKFQPFQLGNYTIVDIVGTGGMGWIYRGICRTDHKTVALKVLSSKQEKSVYHRFKMEASIGNRLDHPNLLRTHKFEETSDVAYMIQDYVEGIDLEELCTATGPLHWSHACGIILQAARGLLQMHQLGIVHRDVKPANLLIDGKGFVQVLDFGLVLESREESEDEFSLAMIFGQQCIGTPDYMSPEQASNSFDVDVRADIYNLGGTFYTALTARLPYPSATVQGKLVAHRDAPVPSPVTWNSDVPEFICELVMQMLAKDPGQRPQTLQHVIDVLTPVAQNQTIRLDFEKVLSQRRIEAQRRLRALYSTVKSKSSKEEPLQATDESPLKQQEETDQGSNHPPQHATRKVNEEYTTISLSPSDAELESFSGLSSEEPLELLWQLWSESDAVTRKAFLARLSSDSPNLRLPKSDNS